jgi:hypothetical protein
MRGQCGCFFIYISLSSYLRSLRGGVGWQVTGWARYKRGPVERLTERGAHCGQ